MKWSNLSIYGKNRKADFLTNKKKLWPGYHPSDVSRLHGFEKKIGIIDCLDFQPGKELIFVTALRIYLCKPPFNIIQVDSFEEEIEEEDESVVAAALDKVNDEPVLLAREKEAAWRVNFSSGAGRAPPTTTGRRLLRGLRGGRWRRRGHGRRRRRRRCGGGGGSGVHIVKPGAMLGPERGASPSP